MHFQVAPDLYEFAIILRRVVENEDPIKQGIMFALGRSNGLKMSTLAGMSNRSESHVKRMLILLKLPTLYALAVAGGTPYRKLIFG